MEAISNSRDLLLKDRRHLHLLVTVAGIKAVCIGTLYLGSHPNPGDPNRRRPLFYCLAQTLPDGLAAHIFTYHQAGNHDGGLRLQAALYLCRDPSNYSMLADRHPRHAAKH